MKNSDINYKRTLKIILQSHKKEWDFTSVKTGNVESYSIELINKLSPMGMFEILISKLEFPLKYEVKCEDKWGIYLQRFEKKFETEIATPYNKILKLFTDTYPGKL